MQFDWTQEQEIKTAKSEGLDTSFMENPVYLAQQMQEIRLGLESGLDVTVYATPEYDWFQMEQIRLGLSEKVDIKQYAFPEYSYETMKQLRLAWHSFVNLEPYLKKGFTGRELKEIRLALEKEYAIDKWLSDDMCAQQIYEIRMGLMQDLEVGIYAQSQYNWLQMQEIRKGLEERIDVRIYAKPLYDHRQMQEIRFGLEAGIDVTSYARMLYTGTDMKKMRQKLVLEETKKRNGILQSDIIITARQAKKEINIMIEENGNKVYAFIPWIPDNIVTKDDILKELNSRGIVFGIDEDTVSEMISKKQLNQRVLVAQGTHPQNGNDGWYEFFVRTNLPHIPAPLPDGSVDYINIDAFEMVKAEQEIVKYHPAEEGTPGMNVFGEEIKSKRGNEKPTLRGEGFRLAPDRVTYLSKLNGKFEYSNGEIIISNMIVIWEDVTGIYGKVEIDGSVHVMGSVHSGGYIKATGDIIVEYNVEAGKLIAGGNVLIKRGSCSKRECYIEAEGEVSGNFFESAVIKSLKNIKANYIMNSDIFTVGKVIISGRKGVLLGGRISAIQGVETYNLGNTSHIKTIIDVGENETYRTILEKFTKQKKEILDEITIFKEGQKRMSSRRQTRDKINAEDMLRKIEIGIRMKEQELQMLENQINSLLNAVSKGKHMPVLVKGKAYAGSAVAIDGIKYVLPQEIKQVIFKKKNKNIVMLRL